MKIRIAHVITKLELGGAQGNTLYTAAHLDRSKFEVHLVTGPGGMLDSEAQQLPVASLTFCKELDRDINPIRDFLAYRELKACFRKLQPDIVHTHSSKAGILGRLAASAAGVRTIVHTYHGFGFHRFQNPLVFRLYVRAERFACRRTHHLVFVSRDNWKWADQLGLTSTCTASLIRSGIPVAEIRKTAKNNAFRSEAGIPKGARLVGMVACLKPQKDPLTFVNAAGIVLQKSPDCHFLLIGDGELRDSVTKLASSLPSGRFHAIGWRRDVYEILRDLDLLVLTSLWEGLPRVLPEAIVSGVPVVASDIDGNREIVLEARAGMLAEPRNATDFGTKILQMLEAPLRVADESTVRVASEFDIDDMISAQEKLYTKLVGG